jgi:hypothetical protein
VSQLRHTSTLNEDGLAGTNLTALASVNSNRQGLQKSALLEAHVIGQLLQAALTAKHINPVVERHLSYEAVVRVVEDELGQGAVIGRRSQKLNAGTQVVLQQALATSYVRLLAESHTFPVRHCSQ